MRLCAAHRSARQPGPAGCRPKTLPVYIGLGSNLGDREAYLRAAVDELRRSEEITKTSSIYETDPVGYLDQPAFLNMVIELQTKKTPPELTERLQEIESRLHRERTFQNAPRTIDLDLLLYDDLVSEDPIVTIPHPRMHERAFVLIPLAEIAPNVVVPTAGTTAEQLLDELVNASAVRYWGEF